MPLSGLEQDLSGTKTVLNLISVYTVFIEQKSKLNFIQQYDKIKPKQPKNHIRAGG